MTKILIILLIAFTFEAFGVIALKKGINAIGVQYNERKAAMPSGKTSSSSSATGSRTRTSCSACCWRQSSSSCCNTSSASAT
jgi:hypothetical protein